MLQRHWEGQENRRETLMDLVHMNKTMYVPSLHVKTVFNVAKPGIIARLLKETGCMDGLSRRC